MASVKTTIVQIGDSQGVLIPKHLLEQCHLQEEVELEPRGNYLIIKGPTTPRAGRVEIFRKMAEAGDDAMLDEDIPLETTWNREEWQ
ncbi:AbrB/MazE/SpoVT family DNA-binding domain-containing protein [Candidatus Poribacteria bacterium]|nr:AbrB/MazE/SpoVT family DNA-binding domain-containing protein [Candidatus Poribacteria bacterium]